VVGGRARRSQRSGKRVLIIVQNLPVPFDRRVWREACALRDAGFQVSVVCPKGPGDPSFQEIEGIRVRKYAPPPQADSPLMYSWEFIYCWVRTLWLVLRAAAREGFDVIQGCNPPDTVWALAAPFKLFGKPFVFDQHDLCPEVYSSRFDEPSAFLTKLLLLLERATYAVADHVIATNESYRETAIGRGGVPPERVTIVRNGPDPDVQRKGSPVPDWRHGKRHLCAYLGVMGPQDGVDLALRAVAAIRRTGRDDVHFVFVGGGDSLDELVALADELGIANSVTFTGRVPDETVFEVLSTADVGLCPDPLNPLNDVSTMTKTMEYMSFRLPVVAFDLSETKVSAGPAAVYVRPNDVEEYAEAILRLLDDPGRRASMGEIGRARVESQFAWRHQVPKYIGVYESLTSHRVTNAPRRHSGTGHRRHGSRTSA
jgi:glycosyltransferase involved in cell wall biosynthesis